MTKIILVVLVIAATLTECIVMRKSREYDAADNIAGLERCVFKAFSPATGNRRGVVCRRSSRACGTLSLG